jgi:hypothetical protein
METCKGDNGGLIAIMALLLAFQIMSVCFDIRERDNRMEEKIDSLTITLDSIQNKLDSININNSLR